MGSDPQQNKEENNCATISYSIDSYESRGKQILLERYQPAKDGRFPVVIFVHGAGGIFARSSSHTIPELDNFGEKYIACSGYIVLLPHYFDSSGHVSALNQRIILENAPLWLQTLEDAVHYVRHIPQADKSRIALYGESLGGYLSIAMATRNRRIKAISVFATGLPPLKNLHRLPPVLVQHGKKDEVVSISEALKISAKLKQLHIPFVFKAYDEIGHYPTKQIQENLAAETVRFFKKFLR